MQMTRFSLATGFAMTLLAGFIAPTATADDKVVLGGSAGIVVDGTYCTLATIGHDKTGELVGFTAGHCGGPGAPVIAEGSENHGSVGTLVAVGDGLDYGVIKFDPAKVTPAANFAGFAINGIGSDPDWHQPVCTQGAANGNNCGGVATMPGPGPRRAMGRAHFQPGDDGAPVTSNGLLIGVVFGGMFVPPDLQGSPPHDFTDFFLFSAIMNDLNAKGGSGAGFSPIPG